MITGMNETQKRWKPGQMIIDARKMKRLRQEDTAKAAGVSRSTVLKVENGVVWEGGEKLPWEVPADTLAKVAAVSGANVRAVLEAAGYDSNTYSNTGTDGHIDVSDLGDDDKDIVASLVRAIREIRSRDNENRPGD